MFTFRRTDRGFNTIDFEDRSQQQCSLQMSSLATEAAVWLGVDRDVNGDTTGFRMHLTQDMAAQLVSLLQHFAETGELPEEDTKP